MNKLHLSAFAAALLAVAAPAMAQDAAPPIRVAKGHFTMKDGEAIYKNVCQACHMSDAMGAKGAGVYPALAGDKRLVALGLSDPRRGARPEGHAALRRLFRRRTGRRRGRLCAHPFRQRLCGAGDRRRGQGRAFGARRPDGRAWGHPRSGLGVEAMKVVHPGPG
ncbi:MAG: c-type cytochrome [Caulobacteraceae bacterium]